MHLFPAIVIVLFLGVYVFTEKSKKREVVVDLSRQLAANRNNVKDGTFVAFVEIAIILEKGQDDDDTLMGNELARKFPHSYNSVAARHADPFKRRVKSGTFIKKRADHKHKKWWFSIKLTGSCKGCPKNTPLFSHDGIKTRRLEINKKRRLTDNCNSTDDCTDDNVNDNTDYDEYAIPLNEFLIQYQKDINKVVSTLRCCIKNPPRNDPKRLLQRRNSKPGIYCRHCFFLDDAVKSSARSGGGGGSGRSGKNLSVTIVKVTKQE